MPTAWLGVQLSPVPTALQSHLRLRDQGVMVGNVFKGSPADQAGIQQFDVVIEADGKPVSSKIESFREYIGGKGPGERLRMTLLRGGEEKQVEVELQTTPSASRDLELKYEEDPDVMRSKGFSMRGRILRPGPGGWEWEDLGDLPDLYRNLPWDSFPFRNRLDRRPGDRPEESEDRPQRDQASEARRVDKDGNVLHVQRDKDGSIRVERYRQGRAEDKRVKTFRDVEQLRESDREAFDLLMKSGGADGGRDRDRDRPRDEFRLRPQPGEGFGPPDERPEVRRWREWADRFFQGPMEPRRLPDPVERLMEPKVKFEVGDEGRITVHLRDGDSALSMTYRSEEEFRERSPELFKQYQEMRSRLR